MCSGKKIKYLYTRVPIHIAHTYLYTFLHIILLNSVKCGKYVAFGIQM